MSIAARPTRLAYVRSRVALVAVFAMLAALVAGAGTATAQPAAASRSASKALLEHEVQLLLGHQAAVAARPTSKALFEQDLDLVIAHVKTTTGTKLYLSISAARVPAFPGIDSADVILETLKAGEAHLWSFPLGPTDFTTTSKGAASLQTASAAGPYGSISLTLTPTGAHKRISVCNANNYTLQQTEKVKGSISFDTLSTGSHAWGTVKVPKAAITFAGGSYLDSTYLGSGTKCTTPPVLPKCSTETSIDWAAVGKTVDFDGSSGSGVPASSIFATRETRLSTPKGATRLDLIDAASPAPKLTTSGKSAEMTVTTSGHLIRGAGTLKSTGSPATLSEKCKGGSGKATTTTWKKGSFAGSSSFKATEQIFGRIKIPAKFSTEIDRTTT
jgi:hypothetical protein